MHKFKNNKQLPFWLLTFAVIIVLIVSQLIKDGVFMDGMLYISVSKNLADGIGTFWNPHFSQTTMSSFHEQPPLYFGLLAIFYKIFGTSVYVERLFCLICFIITAIYIHKLWKKIFIDQPDIAENSWVPILFFTTIPVCFWAYTNHVEETVMSVFTIIAVYYAYIALFLEKNSIYNLILSGIFIFLSSLTKGFQGLFPLVCAGMYWIVMNNFSLKKTIIYSLVLISVPVLIYSFLLLTNDAVLASYQKYIDIRILGTFNNKGATTDNRFDLLTRLLMELLPIISISALILFFTKKDSIHDSINKLHYPLICWFLLIGLSGSLPLMVTLEQRGFYLVTTFPFFSIAISMWLVPRITIFINKINTITSGFKIFKISMIALFFAASIFSFSQIGQAKRDKEILSDIFIIGKIIPHGEIIGIHDKMWNDWSLTAYLIRYFYISCDGSDKKHNYYLIRKELPRNKLLDSYDSYPIHTKCLDLYVLKN